MLVLALGFGLGVMAVTQAAVSDVRSEHAGVASALLNSAQQIGVALGLAVLAGVAATITASPTYVDVSRPDALVAGYNRALLVATGLLFVAAVVAVITLTNRPATTTEIEPSAATQSA